MSQTIEPETDGGEFRAPPFLYEIRVKGRLSPEQWASWFDDLTVVTDRGESLLRGRVPDHAALYGLLARLQDLAVPLIAVKVLDAEAQRLLARQSRQYDLLIDLLLGVVYILVVGGLAAVTVFAAPVINVALALALLFAVLGGLAHAFWLFSRVTAWRWVAYVAWPSAAICFLIFIPVSGILPVAPAIAIMLFLATAGLLPLLRFLRRHAQEARNGSPGAALPEPRAAGREPRRQP